eukprot:4786759-Amphidinium_carterae.1
MQRPCAAISVQTKSLHCSAYLEPAFKKCSSKSVGESSEAGQCLLLLQSPTLSPSKHILNPTRITRPF